MEPFAHVEQGGEDGKGVRRRALVGVDGGDDGAPDEGADGGVGGCPAVLRCLSGCRVPGRDERLEGRDGGGAEVEDSSF